MAGFDMARGSFSPSSSNARRSADAAAGGGGLRGSYSVERLSLSRAATPSGALTGDEGEEGKFVTQQFKPENLLKINPFDKEWVCEPMPRARQAALREAFCLPDEEQLLGHFFCAHRRPASASLLQGQMFVFSTLLVFQANILGVVKIKRIAFADVEGVRKKAFLRMPNTVAVARRDAVLGVREELFTSFFFASRARAYELLLQRWAKARPECALSALAQLGDLSPPPPPPFSPSSPRHHDDALMLPTPPTPHARARPGGSGGGSGSAGGGANTTTPLTAPLRWVEEGPPLPPPDDDHRLMFDATLPAGVTPREFATVLLSDGSGFLPHVLRASEGEPLRMTPWTPAPSSTAGGGGSSSSTVINGCARVFEFIYVARGPMGRIRSACTQRQQYRVAPGGGLMYEHEQHMPDLPAGLGRAFHLAVRWYVEPVAPAAAAPATASAATSSGSGGVATAAAGHGSSDDGEAASARRGASPPARGSSSSAGSTPGDALASSAAATGALRASTPPPTPTPQQQLQHAPHNSSTPNNSNSAAPRIGSEPALPSPPPPPLALAHGATAPAPLADADVALGALPLTPAASAATGVGVASSPQHATSAPPAVIFPPPSSAFAAPASPSPAAAAVVNTNSSGGLRWRVYLAVRFTSRHMMRANVERSTFDASGAVYEGMLQQARRWLGDPSARVPIERTLPPPPAVRAHHHRHGSGGARHHHGLRRTSLGASPGGGGAAGASGGGGGTAGGARQRRVSNSGGGAMLPHDADADVAAKGAAGTERALVARLLDSSGGAFAAVALLLLLLLLLAHALLLWQVVALQARTVALLEALAASAASA